MSSQRDIPPEVLAAALARGRVARSRAVWAALAAARGLAARRLPGRAPSAARG